MHIRITTTVSATPETVFTGFNEQLFLALNPPWMPAKLLRFDGCNKGDEVHIELPLSLLWVSQITDKADRKGYHYFMDEGLQLPFFLSSWQHRHLVQERDGRTEIVDDIRYKSPLLPFDYLLFPFLYLQFYYRKSIYRRFFGSV